MEMEKFLIETTGHKQYNEYIQQVLLDKTKAFHGPISKNYFYLFKEPKKKETRISDKDNLCQK